MYSNNIKLTLLFHHRTHRLTIVYPELRKFLIEFEIEKAALHYRIETEKVMLHYKVETGKLIHYSEIETKKLILRYGVEIQIRTVIPHYGANILHLMSPSKQPLAKKNHDHIIKIYQVLS